MFLDNRFTHYVFRSNDERSNGERAFPPGRVTTHVKPFSLLVESKARWKCAGETWSKHLTIFVIIAKYLASTKALISLSLSIDPLRPVSYDFSCHVEMVANKLPPREMSVERGI